MAPPRSAVNLGSCIAGIPITLHYTFFVLCGLYFVDAFLSHRSDYPVFMLFVVILYGPVLFVTILIHELGHALMTKRLGGEVGGIVLWPLGGFALCGPVDSLRGELKVALAGPITHVFQGLVWWIVYASLAGSTHGWWPSWIVYLDVLSNGVAGFMEILSAQALWMNIVLLCFNLFLPAYPLDGGRIYAASLILVFKMKSMAAAKVTAGTAMIISAGMILYSVYTFLARNAGSGILLGLVGVFVLYQSSDLWNSAKRNDLANHPIFGRECYSDGNENSNSGGGGSGQERDQEIDTVPAQTEEAEMV